jgi:hypothetical protein
MSEDTKDVESVPGDLASQWQKVIRRRHFLHGLGLAGAATALPSSNLFADDGNNNGNNGRGRPSISKGDAALLRFAAAAEAIEADLWQQYNELGGAVDHNDKPNPGNPAYVAALSNLDSDMSQYISDNTDDEISHRDFLNAYLKSKGAAGVDFSQFATLQGSMAAGAAQNVGRITNLKTLTVDTSWYFRYRSTQNPDLGAQFPQLINIVKQPAIPLLDSYASSTIQAIANVAGIHFAFIEQGGSSLYPILALKASNLEVLRILLAIGGVEVNHFSLWHDKMGNAVAQPLAPLSDPVTGLTFPDFNNAANQHNAGLSAVDQAAGSQMFQTNLILPEPCQFIDPSLPPVSITRPTLSAFGGPMAAVKAFTADNLFVGQPPAFLQALMDLASDAEAAQREVMDR